MRHRLSGSLLAALALVLTALPTTSASSSEPLHSRASASLQVSPPTAQLAGQRLTFTGNIGRPGVRRVRVQTHLGRPGDIWRDMPVPSSGSTTASGDFVLHAPATSSRVISYRVAAKGVATPGVVGNTVNQEVALSASSDAGPGRGVVGAPLALEAVALGPAVPGRTLTLQERVRGREWATVASIPADSSGGGTFVVTPGAAGQHVFRVRMEDVTASGHDVGWFPSFPVYVDVLTSARAGRRLATAATLQEGLQEGLPEGRPAALLSAAQPRKAFQTTAGRTLRWGDPLHDFDWEYGESLTDRPTRGRARRGSWVDTSSGTGRVALFNGAMQVSGAPARTTPLGSVWADLRGTARKYGRWEARVARLDVGDAAFKVELVPADQSRGTCSDRSITLLEVAPGADRPTIGATSATGRRWQRRLGIRASEFHAFAVVVRPGAIRWLVDGKVVGKVTTKAAFPGKRLTVRVSHHNAPGATRSSRALVDWVRGWSLKSGKDPKGGMELRRSQGAPACR